MNSKKDMLGLYNAPRLLFEETKSTIDEAKKIIQNDAVVFGESVLSSYQTEGRGQYGKVWLAQKNTSILQTHIIIPSEYKNHNIKLTAYPQINIVFANSIIKTIKTIQDENRQQNITLKIKWPNDILLNEKKIAGILTEQYKSFVLVSYGINIKHQDIFDDIKNKQSFNFLPTCLEEHNIQSDPSQFYAILKKTIEVEFTKPVKEIFDFANTMLWKKNECVLFSPHHAEKKDAEKITILAMSEKGALLVNTATQKNQHKHSGSIVNE